MWRVVTDVTIIMAFNVATNGTTQMKTKSGRAD